MNVLDSQAGARRGYRIRQTRPVIRLTWILPFQLSTFYAMSYHFLVLEEKTNVHVSRAPSLHESMH